MTIVHVQHDLILCRVYYCTSAPSLLLRTDRRQSTDPHASLLTY